MHALRRHKLARLIADVFNGDRGAFLTKTGLTKGRLSQLLDPSTPFGDVAARNLEDRLELPAGYFDAMDARTLDFALRFEHLPPHQKAQWEQLVGMLTTPKAP